MEKYPEKIKSITTEPEHLEEKDFLDEIFDPEEELAYIKEEIKKTPVNEQSQLRRKLINEFKEKLIWQRKGIADLKRELEEFVEKEPDAPKEKFLEIIKRGKKEYWLSPIQTGKFNQVIDRYLEKHQTIQKYVDKHQMKYGQNWQKKLFYNLFYSYPKGKIEIEIKPANIIFYCHEIKDYAQIDDPENLACCVPRPFFNRDLNRLILVVNLPFNLPFFGLLQEMRKEDVSPDIIKHEIQHTIFYLQEGNLVSPKRENLKFFDRIRQQAFQFAKSEILARLKQGNIFFDIFLSLADSRYNFFARLHPPFTKIKEKILGRFEKKEKTYFNFVNQAINSAKEISEIQPFDNRDKLVDLLSLEKLEKWPRLARMIKEIENYGKKV